MKSADKAFHNVGQEGLALTAAGEVFAFPEKDEFSQTQPGGDPGQDLFADDD
jgi:hypothetical protein